MELENAIFDSAIFMTERLFLHPTADLKSLVVWNMEKQLVLGQLEGHDRRIDVVAARGSLAVSCQRSGSVRARVWNLETMQSAATLPGGPDDVATYSACCTEGGLLLGQGDGVIRVWNVAVSAPVALADLRGHAAKVLDIKAAAAGSMVLSGSVDGTVRLWDLRANIRCVRTMEGHTQEVLSVDMARDCLTAVSSSADRMVKLWDLGSGQCVETYEGHRHGVTDVVMHEAGTSVISYGHNFVHAWAMGSPREIMRADMASTSVPGAASCRLFASRDLMTVALCSISSSQLGLSVWR